MTPLIRALWARKVLKFDAPIGARVLRFDGPYARGLWIAAVPAAMKILYAAKGGIQYSPLNQPALWAEPEASRGAAPARP